MSDLITKRGHKLAVGIIKQFEGKRLNSYQDQVGVWTIGWGTTHHEDGTPVHSREMISEARAEELLAHDMYKFEAGIKKHIPQDLGDNADAALISFVYNLGLGNLYHSTLLRYLVEGNLDAAANEFHKWNHSAGRVSRGLTRRRGIERDLFLKQGD